MTTTEQESVRNYTIKIAGSNIDEDMVIRLAQLEISLALNMPGMFTMRFEDDDLIILTNSKVNLGDAIEISVPKNDENDTEEVIFSGEITAIEPEYEYGLRTVVNVRGYDFSHRLTHGTHIRTFQNSKDSDIVSTMAGEAGLTASVEATTTVHDYIMQYNQTNMDFLRQLARRNNYKFFVDKDKKLQFKKAATVVGSAIELKWGDNLLGFYPRLSLTEQVTEVTVRGWDVATKEAVVGTAATASYLQTIGEEQKGGTAYKSATTKDAKHYEVIHMTIDQTYANALAQAILDELNSDYVEAEGLCLGDAQILPGGTVKVSQVNTQLAGTYKVSMVRHIFTREGFKTEFTVEGMRPEFMSDLLGNSDEKILTNQKVNGVVPAIVTQNSDEENLHRVRVKYPWLSDDEESWWARVATPDAGPDRGMTFLPEVNDEVLVAFEHGDMGRPYVVGRVWNGTDAVPHTSTELVADGKVNLRVIKTRSGHVLTFDDTADAELISLVDKTTKNLIKIESSLNKITIDANGGKAIITMDGEAGTMKIVTDDTFDIESGGNMTLKSGGNMLLDAGTNNVDIKGSNVKITASSNAEVKATSAAKVEGATTTVKGSASATVDGGGSTTIKGGMVAIN
jgi:Rhs element Vgr protein